MQNQRQITRIQAAAILVSTIIGVGVLALPLFAVRTADSGAPLVTLLGIVVAGFGLWLLTILGVRFPDKSIVQYSELLLGRWAAGIGSLLIIVFFTILTALAAREFGSVVVTSILKETPLEVTVIVMLLLAALATRKDMYTFSYIHLFYMPFILAPAILIVIFSLKNATYLHLFPLTGNEPHNLFKGTLTIAALFQGYFVYTIIIPYMRKPEKALQAGFIGIVVSGGLYVLIVIATVAVFGSEETKNLLWPTLELAKTTSLPANILERLDAAFLAVWVTAVFTTLYSSYYLIVILMSQVIRLKDHRAIPFFIFPFIFLLAMMPQNVLQMYEIIAIVGRIGLIVTVVYPFLLLMIAMIRKKR